MSGNEASRPALQIGAGAASWLQQQPPPELVYYTLFTPLFCPTVASDEEEAAEELEPDAASLAEQLDAVEQRLQRIETALQQLVEQRTTREWYTTAELALLLGKAEFTIREWCRLGRIRADKRRCGRGRSQEWMISHAELARIRNEGLLPQETVSTRIG
jgi:hypothetical protein